MTAGAKPGVGQDLPSLIDQLGAAAMVCRELLADVRTATKELRAAVREAHEVRAELADAVQNMAKSDIEEAVAAEIGNLADATKAAMEDAIAAVGKKFKVIENILMTGSRRGRPKDGLDLRNLLDGGQGEERRG